MWPPFAFVKDHAEVLLAAGAAISGGWRYGVLPLRARWRARSSRIAESRATIQQAARDISEVKREIFPNHGSSMRDTIDRLGTDVRVLRRTQAMNGDFMRELSCVTGALMIEFDALGDLLWATERMLEMMGLRLDQAAGTGWFNALYYEDRDWVEDRWRDAVANRRPMIETFRIKHVDTNAITIIRIDVSPSDSMLDDKQTPAGWTATVRAVPTMVTT